MNRMLVVVFDDETAAEAGTRAIKRLDSEGGITLYATGVIAKAEDGQVSVNQTPFKVGTSTGVGLAVSSLISLLRGSVGLTARSATRTLFGAVRNYWGVDVGLEFVEESARFFTRGKVALVAEIDEDWVIPVDTAMEASAGIVFRRTRAELGQAQNEQDIVALAAKLTELEGEYEHAASEAKIKLLAKKTVAKAKLQETMQRATDKFNELKLDADAKVKSVEDQIAKVQNDFKARLENRITILRGGYTQRIDKRQQALCLTNEALTT